MFTNDSLVKDANLEEALVQLEDLKEAIVNLQKNRQAKRANRLLATIETPPPSQRESTETPAVETPEITPASASQSIKLTNKTRPTILCDTLTDQQRVLALRDAVKHPKIRAYSKSANLIDNKRYEALEYNAATMTGRLIERANKTDDQRSYKASIVLGISGNSPEVAERMNKPSQRLNAQLLGIPRRTLQKLMIIGKEKRREIRDNIPTTWAAVRKRIGRKKVSPSVRKKLHEWIANHPHMIQSPVAKDTLLIRDPNDSKKKIRVAKLLI